MHEAHHHKKRLLCRFLLHVFNRTLLLPILENLLRDLAMVYGAGTLLLCCALDLLDRSERIYSVDSFSGREFHYFLYTGLCLSPANIPDPEAIGSSQ